LNPIFGTKEHQKYTQNHAITATKLPIKNALSKPIPVSNRTQEIEGWDCNSWFGKIVIWLYVPPLVAGECMVLCVFFSSFVPQIGFSLSVYQ
jgi:hypothetical protein